MKATAFYRGSRELDLFFSGDAAFAAFLAALLGLGHRVSNIGLGEGGRFSPLAPKPYFETDKEII